MRGFGKTGKLVLALVFFMVILDMAQAAIPTIEREALIAIYNATGGDSWTNTTGGDVVWDTSNASIANECNWYGVTCDASESHVTILSLSFNGLSGELPAELGDLSALQELTLYGNQLTAIPAAVGNLTQLQQLNLNYNLLTSVPATLGELNNLIFIGLYANQLTTIPAELGQLTRLQALDLGANQLTTIPLELANLVTLQRLWLGENQLTAIPVELGNLVNLLTLDLGKNELTSIPAELARLSNLQELWLNDNQLGSVPAELGNLSNLVFLYLARNQLSSIPAALGNLTNLKTLSLAGNRITGAIPADFANLTALTNNSGLDLGYNGLYTSDAALLDFLNTKQSGGDLMASQTLDAINVSYNISIDSVTLNWDKVEYTESGGYRIYLSLDDGASFHLAEDVAKKTETSRDLIGLCSNYTYQVQVHSYTKPSDFINQNEVESDGQWGNTVTLTLPDGGNCVPFITGGVGGYDIAEDAAIGTSVAAITAEDNDTLSYSITTGNDEGKFTVDSATGVITLVSALDYETTNLYTLTISVSDGTSSTEGTVTVAVTDVNENSVPDNPAPADGGGSGGGGCTLHSGAAFDPLLPFMLLSALFYLRRRIRAGRQLHHS